jgi:hypothetical protein
MLFSDPDFARTSTPQDIKVITDVCEKISQICGVHLVYKWNGRRGLGNQRLRYSAQITDPKIY